MPEKKPKVGPRESRLREMREALANRRSKKRRVKKRK